MSGDPINPAGSTKIQALKWALIFEGAVALVLGALGVWFIVSADQPAPWTGFGLIGLGLMLYLLRGQVITKLSVGKDGVAWEMAQAAKELAEEAKKEATIAKGVASQYAPPSSLAPGKQKARSPVVGATDGWSHPDLDQGKKVANDPQKNQWGGKPVRNDRRLDAKVTRADKDWYDIVMTVRSTEPQHKPLVGRVRFHLHDSFSRDAVMATPKDGVATLERYAYGAFTIGAEVEGEPDTYLELDMAADEFDAPERFKAL